MKRAYGFTIVELLIVIVVIAILAAISVATYSSIQDRARVSATKSALSQVAKDLEIFKVDNGRYPTTTERSEFGEILTRADAEGGTAMSRYIVCSTATGGSYAVVAWLPVNPDIGGDLHYVSSAQRSPGVETMTALVGGTTGGTVCGIVHPASTMGSSTPTWSQGL